MAAYSMDLRERVIADCEAGISSKEIAVKYRVSRSWVDDLKRRFRETGSIAPKKIGGYRQSPLLPKVEKIKELLKKNPDFTLKELHQQLGVNVSLVALWGMINRLGFSFKKNRSSFRTRPS